MVVQVGDKVLVYGAGTPWGFAKKIEPLKVGDKVDIVTLSDGTKLAMPKIELDTGEYVWVVPEWECPFNIGDLPFQWGMMPLGAAVFTITGKSCFNIDDDYRSWDKGELSDFYLIDISLVQRIKNKNPTYYNNPDDLFAFNTFVIDSNSETSYLISRLEELLPPRDLSFEFGETVWTILLPSASFVSPTLNGSFYKLQPLDNFWKWDYYIAVSQRCNLSGAHTLSFKYRGMAFYGLGSSTPRLQFSFNGIGATNEIDFAFGVNVSGMTQIMYWNPTYGCNTNPSYPDYDTIAVNIAKVVNGPAWDPDANHYDTVFRLLCLLGSNASGRHYTEIDVTDIAFEGLTGECTTGPLLVGDNYIIYNPTTKRLVINDSGKLITSINWINCAEGSIAEIVSDSVEYVWDGQGYVYLTSSKTTFSTIQFDDLLQVLAVHGETVHTIPFHLGERIAQGDETVSRELTNITSILRSGKNTIKLTAKNQDGTKVGFVTAVYVKRNMTKVSL